MYTTLTKKEIEKKSKTLNAWTLNARQTELSKMFYFTDFMKALSFVAKITVHAEILEHYPNIELSYGRVKVKLSTQDLKGLTNADFLLAENIDLLKK